MHLAAFILFPALMIYAAASDLLTMTISNKLSIALLAAFVPFAWMAGMTPAEIGLHLACGAGVLVLTFGLFAMRWIGGGDAKLAAATAVWMGWDHLGDYGTTSAIIGGLLTLAILLVRQYPLPGWGLKFGWLTTLHDRGTGIPYGIALAAGGLLIYPETLIWSGLASG